MDQVTTLLTPDALLNRDTANVFSARERYAYQYSILHTKPSICNDTLSLSRFLCGKYRKMSEVYSVHSS